MDPAHGLHGCLTSATFHGSRKTRAAASGVLQVTTHNPKGYEPKEAALLRLDSHVNAAASTPEW